MNFTAIVIPAFFFFMALEYLVTKQRRLQIERNYENAVSNITIGIAERLLNLFIAGSFFGIYQYIYEHFALWKISQAWYVWILLLLATDLVWYWYHRLGHEINLMWGAHVVHHQSEEFNYTVSARITTIQALIRNVFWCILPLAGFHPTMVMAVLVVHGTYSFFTHTETIGKLGWIENILITPSHHRVHHASNEKYLNKNYGDIFVFWDKLFGTFQAEDDRPVYGLTHPLKSRSFLWQHFHYYLELWEACKRSGNFAGSLKILFGRPESLDARIRAVIERRLAMTHFRVSKPGRFRLYINVQIALCAVGLFYFTLFFQTFSAAEKTFVVCSVLITLINCGAILEQQRWVYNLEIFRALCLNGLISYALDSPSTFAIVALFIVAIALSETSERLYYRFLYSYA